MSRFHSELVARAFRSYFSWLHRCGYSDEQINQPAAYACVRDGDVVVLANSYYELARYAVERTPTVSVCVVCRPRSRGRPRRSAHLAE